MSAAVSGATFVIEPSDSTTTAEEEEEAFKWNDEGGEYPSSSPPSNLEGVLERIRHPVRGQQIGQILLQLSKLVSNQGEIAKLMCQAQRITQGSDFNEKSAMEETDEKLKKFMFLLLGMNKPEVVGFMDTKAMVCTYIM